MKFLVALIKILLFTIISSSTVSATTWFARTDGGTTSQCTGIVDAPYDGSGTGEPCAYSSLQNAATAAQYGDTIIARAGDSWGQLNIPTKNGTPSVITVKSSNEASIPIRLHGVINADASNMAKIATVNDNFAIFASSSTSHWKFIGFEITTANRSQYYQILLDIQGNNIDFDKCWIHSLEDYTTLTEASCRIGITYSGSSSDITNSRIAYFSAFVLGTTIVDNNFALIYNGSNMLIENSYMGAWFDTIISGGSSFSPLISGVTVSGSPAPTTTNATISNVTGISIGTLIAFRNYPQRTLTNACSFTGATKTLICAGGDFNEAYRDVGGAGTPSFFFPNLGIASGVTSVTNSTTLILQSDFGGINFTNQTVNIDGVYGAVRVTGISGNNITYTPHGITGLRANPEVPGNAQWGGFVPNNLTIRKSKLHNDPVIAAAVLAATGANPKAFWEIKAIDGFIVDGVEFTGFGTNLGFLVANQGTPFGCPSVWTRINNISITNSYYNTDANPFQVFGFALTNNYYCTSSGGSNIIVSNNLIRSGGVLSRLIGGTNVQFTHNTSINDDSSNAQLIQQEASGSTEDTIGFLFSNNIAVNNFYGLHCSYGGTLVCFPSATINNNVLIGVHNTDPWCSSGLNGTNNCTASLNNVQFVNINTNNFRLSSDSPYKGTGSSGTDPGVNWTNLVNALGFDPSGVPSRKCNWNTTPICN